MHFSIKHPSSFFLLVPLIFILIAGCTSSVNIAGMDISRLYTGQKGNPIKLIQLYNIDDSYSAITVELPGGLVPPDPATKNFANFGTLKYEIIGDAKRISVIDSATFSIPDSAGNQSFISHTWTFRAPAGIDYYISVTYTIPGVQEDFRLLEFLGKTNRNSQSWFRFQAESGEFFADNILTYPQQIRLITNDSVNRRFLVKRFSREFPLPYPPFVEQYRKPFNYLPDSTFVLQSSNGATPYFTPDEQGFYFFQPDTNELVGPTLFRVYGGFPKVTMHTLMLDALRYITSAKEFQQLESYKIPKLAVDSFWIANAGRPDLATELIRKYYSRVETGNQLFTSFTEGWKTDRGMIYIVLGKPTRVFRTFDQEVWIYGQQDDPRAWKLYFNKVINPFTDNDYVLIRNENLKSYWYQNVQVWRR